jgi:signal transduction histidine kinase
LTSPRIFSVHASGRSLPSFRVLLRLAFASACGFGFSFYLSAQPALPSVPTPESAVALEPAAALALQPKAASLDTSLAIIEARHQELYRAADYSAAIAAAREGLALAEQSGSPRQQGPFLRHLAYDYWLMGETDLALDYSQRLIETAEKLGDKLLLAQAHRYLSISYAAMGDFARARPQAETTLRLAETAGEPTLVALARQDVAINQMKAGNFAAARATFEEVRTFWEQQGNRWNAYNTLANLADLSEAEGDLPTALSLYEKIYAVRVELADRRGQVRALSALASLLLKLHRSDEALVRLATARPLALAIGGHRLLAEFHSAVARTQEARRDFGAALSAERQAAAEREQFAGERARLRASDLAGRLDTVQKQRSIDALIRDKVVQDADLRAKEAELAHARFLRFALLDGLILVALAFAGVVLLQRTRLRAERRILAETRAAKEAAEKADLAKTRFLAVASHEIRAPLGNVVNLLSSLRPALHASGEPPEHLDLITAETQRVLALVEDLLTTAAIDGDQLKLRRAPFDLTDIVRAVLGTSQWQIAAKRLTVVFPDPAPGAGFLVGDATRIYQAISNLISNAIKFSPQGKAISLSVLRDDLRVHCVVGDEGPGISETDAARLFTPFERLSARPTAGESSHGLGLSIVHEIARLHDGTIRFLSQPNQGAVFTLSLPIGDLPDPSQ